MPLNIQNFWNQILMMGGSVFILILFAVALGMQHKPRILSGHKGHREEKEEDGGEETIRPDGYIDSFSGEIEEAGGGMPPVVKIFLPLILLWWLGYLILYIVIL